MFRKVFASLTIAAGLLSGIGITTSASAAARHSDIYAQTIGHGWVAVDQLTASELIDLAAVCQPVTYAVSVPALTYAQQISGVPVISHLANGRLLIAEGDANVAQLSEANANQVGLNVPAFIGPTSYSVTSAGFAC